MFGFFKKQSPTLLCALYPGSFETAGNMFVRSDVDGFATFLMFKQGSVVRSANPADLAGLKLDPGQAWIEAAANTRKLLNSIQTEVVVESPKVVVLASTDSLARHAAMLFWSEHATWTGTLGSAVLFLDRFTIAISPCDKGDNVADGLAALVQLAIGTAEAESESGDVELELFWRDSRGFEPIGFANGAPVPGPRLTQIIGSR